MMNGGRSRVCGITTEDNMDELNAQLDAMFSGQGTLQARVKAAEEMILEARVIGLQSEMESLQQLVKSLTREIERKGAMMEEMEANHQKNLNDLQEEHATTASKAARVHRNLTGVQKSLEESSQIIKSLTKMLLNDDNPAEMICKMREKLGIIVATATSSPAPTDDPASTQQQ